MQLKLFYRINWNFFIELTIELIQSLILNKECIPMQTDELKNSLRYINWRLSQKSATHGFQEWKITVFQAYISACTEQIKSLSFT